MSGGRGRRTRAGRAAGLAQGERSGAAAPQAVRGSGRELLAGWRGALARHTGLEMSVGAGATISSAGGEAISLVATSSSAMGAAAMGSFTVAVMLVYRRGWLWREKTKLGRSSLLFSGGGVRPRKVFRSWAGPVAAL